jgi:hypothetical protein
VFDVRTIDDSEELEQERRGWGDSSGVARHE